MSEWTLNLAERDIFVEALEQVLFRVLLELRLKYTWLIKLFSSIVIIILNSLVLLAYKCGQRVCARTKRIVIVWLILISSDNLTGTSGSWTESWLSKHLYTMHRFLIFIHFLVIDHYVGNIDLVKFRCCSTSAFTTRSETFLCGV